MDYDLHIHTEYCGHAQGMTIPAIIERAGELGLKTIAITDHIFGPDDLPLIEKIRAEVNEIKSRCRIIIGAEVDVDGMRCDGRLVTDRLESVDYVVATIHYIPGVGNYPFSPDDSPLKPGDLFGRWESTLLGLVANRAIHTLAHPGRMIAASIDLDIFFDDVLAVFSRAAELSAQNNIAWELNELTGIRLSDYYRGQWYRIYQLAVDAGVKLIYGSDAHDIASIGKCQFAEEILKKLPANCLSRPEVIIDNAK